MAVCETCHGSGRVLRHFSSDSGPVLQHFPCPNCIGGPNAASCCEGEQWSEREIEIEQVKK